MIAGPDEGKINEVVQQIKDSGLNIAKEGTIDDFVGIHIEQTKEETFILLQNTLIKSILKDLHLDQNNTSTKATPAKSSVILQASKESPEHDNHFRYRSVIGKLNFLEKATRTDITYTAH